MPVPELPEAPLAVPEAVPLAVPEVAPLAEPLAGVPLVEAPVLVDPVVAPTPEPEFVPLPVVGVEPEVVAPDPVVALVPVPPVPLPLPCDASPLELPEPILTTTCDWSVGELQATNVATASEIQGVIETRRDRSMMCVPPVDAARQQLGVSRPRPHEFARRGVTDIPAQSRD
jgi:hypothetical protein